MFTIRTETNWDSCQTEKPGLSGTENPDFTWPQSQKCQLGVDTMVVTRQIISLDTIPEQFSHSGSIVSGATQVNTLNPLKSLNLKPGWQYIVTFAVTFNSLPGAGSAVPIFLDSSWSESGISHTEMKQVLHKVVRKDQVITLRFQKTLKISYQWVCLKYWGGN